MIKNKSNYPNYPSIANVPKKQMIQKANDLKKQMCQTIIKNENTEKTLN